MTTLNKTAAEVVTVTHHVGTGPRPSRRSNATQAHDRQPPAVHALTDVTGFGLIAHAREMALASNVSLGFNAAGFRCSKAHSIASAPATSPEG